MKVNWGEDCGATGQADSKKTRAERERELRALLQTQAGREVVEYYFLKYTGGLRGILPPAGLRLVETILDHEYAYS